MEIYKEQYDSQFKVSTILNIGNMKRPISEISDLSKRVLKGEFILIWIGITSIYLIVIPILIVLSSFFEVR